MTPKKITCGIICHEKLCRRPLQSLRQGIDLTGPIKIEKYR